MLMSQQQPSIDADTHSATVSAAALLHRRQLSVILTQAKPSGVDSDGGERSASSIKHTRMVQILGLNFEKRILFEEELFLSDLLLRLARLLELAQDSFECTSLLL